MGEPEGHAVQSFPPLGGSRLSGWPLAAVGGDDSTSAEVGDEELNAAIRKSKQVLARQKDLLQQIVERRRAISPVKDSITDTGIDEVSISDNGKSKSNEDTVSEKSDPKLDQSRQTQSATLPKNQNVGVSAKPVSSKVDDGVKRESSIADALGLSRESQSTSTTSYTPLTLPKVSEPNGSVQGRGKTTKTGAEQEDGEVDGEAEDTEEKPPPLAGVNVMNIILAAAECAPWSKTGGLGDVAGALPKALARRGHRVMVVVPKYGNYSDAQKIGETRRYKVDGQDFEVSYYHAYIDGVDFVFIDGPMFRDFEKNIYGGQRLDILKRMTLFCKAAVEVPWRVPCGGVCYGDGNLVFIANDWHTALLPVYLKAYYRDRGLMKYARSVLVIHNIAHQGRGPVEDVNFVDVPEHYHDVFKLYDPVGGEHFNIFAAGLKCADRIVTVSHGYAWELKTSEGGWGLHEIINDNHWKLQGIVNGIDPKEWDPEVDVHLKSDGYTNYSLETLKTGKAECKSALQKELGLPVRDEVPLIGFIGRLDLQKGVDLIAEAMPWISSQDVQLVMLGTGRADLEEVLRRFESQYHNKVRGWVGFSVKTAHRITAGCDILLMPSRFEPCGLNQLYAMKYGTIPVVHAVGGLRDTVKQFDPFNESGTGWTFDRAEAHKLINALGHCLNTYWNYKSSWEGLQERGMSQDLSWDNAASLYEEVLVAAKYQW